MEFPKNVNKRTIVVRPKSNGVDYKYIRISKIKKYGTKENVIVIDENENGEYFTLNEKEFSRFLNKLEKICKKG